MKPKQKKTMASFLSLLLLIQLVLPTASAGASSTSEELSPQNVSAANLNVVSSIDKVTNLTSVNLSEVGDMDWRSIATTQLPIDYDVKKPGASQIKLSEKLGENGTSLMLENGLFKFSSSANENNLSDVRKARSNSGKGAAFTITVPASQQERELKIYLSANQGTIQMSAALGTQSYKLDDFTATNNESGIYTIKYTGVDQQDLVVTGTLSTANASGYFMLGAIALSQAPDHGVNLALGKQVISSPNAEGAEFTANKMLDGNYNTRFSTKQAGNVAIDLGKVYKMNQVAVYWEAAYSSAFTIQVSKDNTTWTTVDSVSGKSDYAPTFHNFAESEARYVKIAPANNANGYSIFEVEVYDLLTLAEANQIIGITSNTGTLLPAFNRNVKEYEVTVGADTESITLQAKLKGGISQFVTIAGQRVPSDQAVTVNLKKGLNEITVVSTDSTDPSIQETYKVNIYKLDYNFGSQTYKNVIQSAKAENGSKFQVTSSKSSFWSPLAQLADGNRYSIAQPNLGANTPWDAKINLGSKYIVDQVKFFSNRGSYLDAYDIQLSTDGSNWKTVVAETAGNGENKTYRFPPTTAQYIQIVGKKAVGFSSISEIEMYGVNVSMESVINSLSAYKISRGDLTFAMNVPDGYRLTIISSSNPTAIAVNGQITPKKNQIQTSKLKFTVQDISSGVTQTSNEIEYTVPALVDLVSVKEVSKSTAEYGKTLSYVLEKVLPATVLVTLSDNSSEALNINWNSASTPAYSETKPGKYVFTGKIVLPPGVSNVNNVPLTVSNEVTLKEAAANSIVITPGNQVLPVPIAGTTKRRFSAKINNTDTKYTNVTWSVNVNKDYISIDKEGMLTIRPSTEMLPGQSYELLVKAKDNNSDVIGTVPVRISFTKNSQSEPSNIKKDGYTLYYADEFNGTDIDRKAWSDYYLRQWATNGDEQARAKYSFDDGSIVLKIDEDTKPWSPLDGKVMTSSIVSYEKPGLHKFGNNKYEDSRNIPTFDGAATTKYGYFEMRAKMPTATDGSHVAWWMVGNQEDQNIYDTGTSYVSNQVSEIDINESPFGTIQANKWFSTYHQWGSDAAATASDPADGYVPTGLNSGSRLDTEFHIYGMEWDENGLKFYFDGKLIRTVAVKLDHRLETLLGLYTNSWGGQDGGIYPKELAIDYFRIYKKNDSIGKINDIFFDLSTVPQKLQKPTAGNITKMKISAIPVDSMHNPVANAELEWYFASDVPFKNETTVNGATIDRKTGEVTITDQIAAGTVLRVSAKAKGNIRIRQSYRVIVENKASSIPTSIFFKNAKNINTITVPTAAAAAELQLEATLYDQYMKPIQAPIEYSLVKDTPGVTPAAPTGVTLTKTGKLVIQPSAKPGEVFYVQAKSGNISNNYIVELAKK